MEYKGYCGSSEISMEDDCLHGRILFIDDLIIFEGQTPRELKEAFAAAVDRYEAHCKQTGKAPNKQYSGSFNVRTGSELHRDASKAASLIGQSLNDYVKESLMHRLAPNRVVVAVTENHHHYHSDPEKNTYDEESIQSWSQNAPVSQNRPRLN
ncbi:hypothetical protein RugamoR64_16260 [Duganella rhizosphaerae]